jgi:hypothetical protein
VFRRSSAVEQLTVNQLVVGSIPTAGASFSKENSYIQEARASEFLAVYLRVTEFVTVFLTSLSSQQSTESHDASITEPAAIQFQFSVVEPVDPRSLSGERWRLTPQRIGNIRDVF